MRPVRSWDLHAALSYFVYTAHSDSTTEPIGHLAAASTSRSNRQAYLPFYSGSAVMENLEKFRGAAVSAKYSYISC
jgi:hypothetical protein